MLFQFPNGFSQITKSWNDGKNNLKTFQFPNGFSHNNIDAIKLELDSYLSIP